MEQINSPTCSCESAMNDSGSEENFPVSLWQVLGEEGTFKFLGSFLFDRCKVPIPRSCCDYREGKAIGIHSRWPLWSWSFGFEHIESDDDDDKEVDYYTPMPFRKPPYLFHYCWEQLIETGAVNDPIKVKKHKKAQEALEEGIQMHKLKRSQGRSDIRNACAATANGRKYHGAGNAVNATQSQALHFRKSAKQPQLRKREFLGKQYNHCRHFFRFAFGVACLLRAINSIISLATRILAAPAVIVMLPLRWLALNKFIYADDPRAFTGLDFFNTCLFISLTSAFCVLSLYYIPIITAGVVLPSAVILAISGAFAVATVGCTITSLDSMMVGNEVARKAFRTFKSNSDPQMSQEERMAACIRTIVEVRIHSERAGRSEAGLFCSGAFNAITPISVLEELGEFLGNAISSFVLTISGPFDARKVKKQNDLIKSFRGKLEKQDPSQESRPSLTAGLSAQTAENEGRNQESRENHSRTHSEGRNQESRENHSRTHSEGRTHKRRSHSSDGHHQGHHGGGSRPRHNQSGDGNHQGHHGGRSRPRHNQSGDGRDDHNPRYHHNDSPQPNTSVTRTQTVTDLTSQGDVVYGVASSH